MLTLAAPAPFATAARAHADATTVAVTMTDSKLAVSPVIVAGGSVVFAIRNRGTGSRSFSIAGKSTRQIAPGRSADLTVDLTGKGLRTYTSVRRGGAGRIKGLLDVRAPCTKPTRSTVKVQMAQDQGGITVSQSTIPCGTVTFVVTNTGTIVDGLKVFGDLVRGQGLTPDIKPGQTQTLTVEFTVKGLAFYESGYFTPMEPELGAEGEGGQFAIV